MNEELKIINISMPQKLMKEIDVVAEQEQRNRSELIRKAVSMYIKSGGETGIWNKWRNYDKELSEWRGYAYRINDRLEEIEERLRKLEE